MIKYDYYYQNTLVRLISRKAGQVVISNSEAYVIIDIMEAQRSAFPVCYFLYACMQHMHTSPPPIKKAQHYDPYTKLELEES